MSVIKSGRITIKSTGEQFWYDAKLAWNCIYYSFDGSTTWHRTKGEAYRAAQAAGTLHRVGEIKVSVAA